MYYFHILACALVLSVSVTIDQPEEGMTYDGDWLPMKAIVENDDQVPDSVVYCLNGGVSLEVARLNTDWYTYMQNDLHHGYSESPAPMDSTILWTAQVTGDYHEFPTPVVVNGIVYYPQDSTGDSLYALDAATGEILWKYYTGYTDDAVTVKDGYLYTASDSLWCLNALTGERVWATAAADNDGSTPAVVDGRVYAARAQFNPFEAYVHCMDAYTGSIYWSDTLPAYTASCMTVYDGKVFVPTYGGALYALDAATGGIVWQNTDSNDGYWDSSPVIVDGMLYILCMDSKARAIDPSTGITQWEVDITPGTYLSATPAYHNGKLYFGDQVDTYHCLSTADGSTVWSVPGVEHGSPGIAEDVVFYGEGSNYYDQTAHVYALNADNGQVIWSYNTTSGPYGIVSSPSITDGVMYIAGTDWNLYAFGTGLKYTYREDQFYAEVGSNQLIVTSYDDGSAVAADTVNFTVTQQGIVVDPASGPHLCVSPNPCSGEATVDFSLPRTGSARLDIYDLTGRMVQTYATGRLSQGQHSIPLSTELPQGIYVVSLTYGDRCITGKLMVSR